MFFFVWSWVKERFISMNCAMQGACFWIWLLCTGIHIFWMNSIFQFEIYSIFNRHIQQFFFLPNYIFSELSVFSNDKNFVEYHENIFQKKIKASKTHWTIRIETANLYGIGAQYLESSSWQRWSIVYRLESMASIFT